MLDYKQHGENSYAFQDKTIWTAILESRLAINDKDISAMALDYILSQGGHAGKVIGAIYGIGEANWNSLPTVVDIFKNEAAFDAVFNHPVASRTLLEYNDYEIIRLKSDEIYKIFNDKPYALNILMNTDKYKSELQSNKTASYNDYCILTTCVSNIGENSQGSSNESGGGNVYAFCKTGLKYTNIDDTVTVLCTKQGTGSTGGVIGLKNPYNVTNYTVNKIVKNVVIEPGYYNHNSNSEYNAISTSTGVISYIPL